MPSTLFFVSTLFVSSAAIVIFFTSAYRTSPELDKKGESEAKMTRSGPPPYPDEVIRASTDTAHNQMTQADTTALANFDHQAENRYVNAHSGLEGACYDFRPLDRRSTNEETSARPPQSNNRQSVHGVLTDRGSHEQAIATKEEAQVRQLKTDLKNTSEQLQTYQRKYLHEQRERATLEKQIEEIQRDVLSAVDQFQPTPDTALISSYQALQMKISNMSRTIHTHLRSQSDEELHTQLGKKTLCSSIKVADWSGHTWRKLQFQSIVWKVLLDEVFRSPFQSLSPKWENIQAMWQELFGATHDQHPEPDTLTEQWRYTTVDQLCRKCEDDETALDEQSQFMEHVDKCLSEALGLEPVKSEVANLIRLACEVAAMLSKQRSRVKLTIPEVDLAVSQNTAGVKAEGDVRTGYVEAVFVPGLLKHGNGHGGDLHVKKYLCDAIVRVKA